MTTLVPMPTILERLAQKELSSGGWAYRPGVSQASLEPTCLALLLLESSAGPEWQRGIRFLVQTQHADGSWPAFAGDEEGSWTTALAVLVLRAVRSEAQAYERGQRWLLKTQGRESHWFWKWKFLIADRHVRFDPNKFGWPWTPETNSWVVPTSFSLLALGQQTPPAGSLARGRIDRGMEMLFDRACPGGGWNAGNGIVYGEPLVAHPDVTAIALLALAREKSVSRVDLSVRWLRRATLTCNSTWSLAWTVMALAAYELPTGELCARLADSTRYSGLEDNSVLAAAGLAILCARGRDVWGIRA